MTEGLIGDCKISIEVSTLLYVQSSFVLHMFTVLNKGTGNHCEYRMLM